MRIKMREGITFMDTQHTYSDIIEASSHRMILHSLNHHTVLLQ